MAHKKDTTAQVDKGERLYLLVTKAPPKIFIKIGCTSDLRARMKNYETHNPAFEQVGSFPMVNRECSRAFEDALLLRYYSTRRKNTEWFEVSDADAQAFESISTFEYLKKFVDLDGFFRTIIETNLARAEVEEKPRRSQDAKSKAAHYKYLRGMIG